jgi:Golgi phosphoprotein 3 (GPP34)
VISLAEELTLLAVEDDGRIAYTAGSPNFAMALVGACLVDLNTAGRIDIDLDQLRVISNEPLGIGPQDLVLSLVADGTKQSAERWILELQTRAPDLVRLALESLKNRGILHITEKRFLWALRSRRYPIDDGKEQKEAKLRILGALLSDDLPTSHDSILIGLAVAGGLLEAFLSRAEIARLAERISLIGGLDLIVRSVEAAIRADAEVRAHAVMLSIH